MDLSDYANLERWYPPGDPYLQQLFVVDEALFALDRHAAVLGHTPVTAQRERQRLRLIRTLFELNQLNRWWALPDRARKRKSYGY
jgi:hypothetical protein